ncbi:purine-cytosine permease family protein [Janibacter limosus]|uniref:purine-cytosine permease family protein n=1 Tax=Janibacter limosus TaxID=53458 RepID=UPI000834E31E|nr:permease [Janibacter limosus]
MGVAPRESQAELTPRAVRELELSGSDDPRVVDDQHHDDYANHVVPISMRLGRWQLAMSFWSLLSAMVWLFYGALASSLFGSANAIIAMVLAVVTYSVGNAVIARWTIRTGLNATLLSRQTFGIFGAIFAAAMLTANTVYYAVFESSTLAVAFAHYTPSWRIEVWYAVVALIMLPLMLGGVQTFMAKLNGALLPFYYVGLIAAVVVTAVRFPVGSAWLDFEGIVPPEARAYPGWVLAFMLYMGLFILMPTTADFARFGKVEDEKFHTNVSFGWVFQTLLFLVNGVVGIFLVRSVIPNEPAAETGVVTALLSSLGVFGLILIVVSQTRINTLNYYESSANASRVITSLTGRRVPRLGLVAGLTAVVFLLMLTDVFSYIQRMLGWQAAFMVGWVGILLAHYALSKGWRATEFRAQRAPRVTWGLAAWLISAAVAIWLEESSAAPAKLAAIAPVAALVIAVVLYTIGYLVMAARRAELPVSDIRLEVDDVWRTYVRCDECTKSYVAYEMDRDVHSDDHRPLCDACAIGSRATNFA